MNYGKKKAAKRQKQITSKSAMQAKRVGVRLFKALLLCIIVVAIAGVAGGGLFVKKIIDNSPDITPDDVKPQGFTTLVYADDGTTEIERFVAQVLTVYIKQSMRFRQIFSMHLLLSRMNVFMSITELISKVLSVPVFLLFPGDPREPVH